MASESGTTLAPLPAKGKRLVELLLKKECSRLAALLEGEHNEDVRCDLETDISFAKTVLAAVSAWDVKRAP